MARRRGTGPGISFFAFQDIITAVVGIFILITLILVLELAQRVEAASAGQSVDITPITASIDSLEKELERLREQLNQRMEVADQSAHLNAFNRAELLDQLRSDSIAASARLNATKTEIQRIAAQTKNAQRDHEKLLHRAAELSGERDLIENLTEQLRAVQQEINALVDDDSIVYRDQIEDGRFLVLVELSGTQVQIRDALSRTKHVFSGARRLAELRKWLQVTSLPRRHLFVLVGPGGADDFTSIRTDLRDSGATHGFTVVGPQHAIKLGYEVRLNR